ncbi:hypothetical protein GCM10008937_15700 [Deinococcus depolymerans]|uniref:Uncharacterized protein n=1 Tax=Deinococcus depolymerans TaxID=392408 RepID=A0ABN1BZH6_9DEIO
MTFKASIAQPVTREDRMRAWIAKHVKPASAHAGPAELHQITVTTPPSLTDIAQQGVQQTRRRAG